VRSNRGAVFRSEVAGIADSSLDVFISCGNSFALTDVK
jgi:hypothetical protein